MKFHAIIAAAAVLMLAAGCTIVREVANEYCDWRGSATNAPAKPPETPATPPPAPPQSIADAADYGAFRWMYGGFNGSRAVQSGVVVADLRMAANMAYYRFERDLSAWGIKHTNADALVCAFVETPQGWIGGKFDWVSSSRTSRDLNHLGTRGGTGYGGWTLVGVPNPTRFAFVVVSADAHRRSNVLVADWRR